ncbi:MAG: ATP-binding protein [bacterium]|nr:ATP-binding protein [bacterium]
MPGKSNLLDLLEFIDIAVRQDLITAVKLKGGFDKIKNFRSKEDVVEIKATFSDTNYFLKPPDHEISGHIVSTKGSTYTFYFKVQKGNRCLTNIKLNIKARYKELYPKGNENVLNDWTNRKYNRIFKGLPTTQLEINLKNEVCELSLDSEDTKSFKRSYRHHVNAEDIGFGVGVIEESVLIRDKSKAVMPMSHYRAILYALLSLNQKMGNGIPPTGINELFKQIETEIKYHEFVDGVLSQRISVYNFDVNRIRSIVKTPASQTLKKNGENLHYILESLKHTNGRNKDSLENIAADLTGVVAELEDIEITMQPMGTEKVPEIFFKERNNFTVSRDSISDGTLSLLAVLTALYSQSFFAFLQAFEEPERHLHLNAIALLMDIFRSRPREVQLMITTQSSEILRNIRYGEDNLIFIYRDYDGFTKAISARDIPEIDTLLQEYQYNLEEIVRNETLGYLGDYE